LIGSDPDGSSLRSRLDEARGSDPLAPELLNLLSFFAPAPLPPEALYGRADRVPGRLSRDGASPERVRVVLRRLAADGVLREEEGGLFLPSELQRIAREDMVRPQAAGYADAAVRILEDLDEEADAPASGSETGFRRRVILSHAPALAKALADLGRAPDRALVLTARAVEAEGDPSDRALRAAERIVGIARESRRLRDPFLLAALLDQLAEVLAARGRREAALGAMREAIEVVREACPPDDPRRAVVFHNAGDLARRLEEPGQAADLLRECLDLLEGSPGESGGLRARTELDLAEALLATEAAAGAASAAARAVATCARRLGARHPETAAAWSLWGRSLRRLGRPPAAAACFRRALEAMEATYGPEHPALGPDLGNLADVLEVMGQAERARDLHERARGIFREAYGPDHRLTRAARRRMEQL
jgi:tetratricopeptide (TPR) repeat protein